MEFYTKSKAAVLDQISNITEKIRSNDILSALGNVGGSITQINSNGATSVINGKTYKGNSISIKGSKVVIDGVVQDTLDGAKQISIVVNGDCKDIQTEYGEVTVNGNSGAVKTHNGEVKILQDVNGGVTTHNGNVKVVGSVLGDVKTHNGNISK